LLPVSDMLEMTELTEQGLESYIYRGK